MGIFDFWKKPQVPTEIDDTVLGRLKRSDCAKDGEYLWSGDIKFPHVGNSIFLHVYAGPEGPTEAQREFYSELLVRYASLQPAIQSALEVELASLMEASEWQPDAKTMKAFELYGLALNWATYGIRSCSFSFGWPPWEDLDLDVYVSRWEITNIGISD